MENNIIEVQNFEVKESDNRIEVDDMDNEKLMEGNLEQTDVLEVLESAPDGLDEEDQPKDEKGRWYEWNIESYTVRSLLKRLKEERLKFPLCQRLYVWGVAQREKLLSSVMCNRSCGVIQISEMDGVWYLVDGLQRITSLMYLSTDYDNKNLTKEQKKMILDYRVPAIVTRDMKVDEIKESFSLYNSGVPLAAAVKYRSTLSEKLNNAIISLSSNNFFREVETKAMFKKNHHHELIVQNAMLAAAGFDIESNKAKDVCERLKDNEYDVLESMDKARIIVERIVEIYKEGIDETVIPRSFNANYLCVLCYIIAKNPQFSNTNIRDITNYIFADKVAIKPYTVTTTNGAADAKKCLNRYNVILNLLNNPPKKEEGENFNKEKFDKWVENLDVIKDTKKNYITDVHEYGPDELRKLYMAQLQNKMNEWDAMVEKVYKRVEESGDDSE